MLSDTLARFYLIVLNNVCCKNVLIYNMYEYAELIDFLSLFNA